MRVQTPLTPHLLGPQLLGQRLLGRELVGALRLDARVSPALDHGSCATHRLDDRGRARPAAPHRRTKGSCRCCRPQQGLPELRETHWKAGLSCWSGRLKTWLLLSSIFYRVRSRVLFDCAKSRHVQTGRARTSRVHAASAWRNRISHRGNSERESAETGINFQPPLNPTSHLPTYSLCQGVHVPCSSPPPSSRIFLRSTEYSVYVGGRPSPCPVMAPPLDEKSASSKKHHHHIYTAAFISISRLRVPLNFAGPLNR